MLIYFIITVPEVPLRLFAVQIQRALFDWDAVFRRFAFTIWKCPGRKGWMKVFSVFTDPALCPPAPTTSHPADAFHLHRANRPGSLNCIQQAANVKDTGESHTHTYKERPLKWTERFIFVRLISDCFYFKKIRGAWDSPWPLAPSAGQTVMKSKSHIWSLMSRLLKNLNILVGK